MSTAYTHEPLSTNEHFIRLLTIQPGEDDDPITVALQNVRLSDVTTKYDAISYMWGSANETHRILVNDAFITVRSNIYRFLRHYRRYFIAQNRAPLWIDSICIAQYDLSEKGSQVAGMGQVFSNARQVLIWLGNVSEKTCVTQKDLDLVQRTYHRTVLEDESLTPSSSTYEKELATSKTLFENNSQLATANVDSVKRLEGCVTAIAEHPHWLRMWIVQESTLAREGPKVVQGTVLLSGDVLGVMKHATRLSSEDDLHKLQTLASFKNLCPSTDRRTPFDHKVLLSSWVHFYCFQLCEDPRDRIYALLGMVDPDSSAAKINVNYKSSVWQLFIQTLDVLVEECEKKSDDLISLFGWTKTLAYALELRSSEISMLEKSTSNDEVEDVNWKPLTSPFQQAVVIDSKLSAGEQLNLLYLCKLSIPISIPHQRLHRDPRRWLNSSYLYDLVRCESQYEAQPIGWRFRLWLAGRLQHTWVPKSQYWMCKLGGEVPLVFRPSPDGKLEVLGYVYQSKDSPSYRLTLLPNELQRHLQDEFDENVDKIKTSWSEGEQFEISLPIFRLLQLGELGRKAARGISYGSGLLS